MKYFVRGLLLSLIASVAFTASPPPLPAGFSIYREQIVTPQHLDWLWQDYLVNGQIKAIEKLTSALELGVYAGALKKAQSIRGTRPLTDSEKQAAVRDAVFSAAMWSLESNAKQHHAVAAELIRIEAAERDTQGLSHAYLLTILTKVQPDKFRIVDRSGGLTFSTPSGNVRFIPTGK